MAARIDREKVLSLSRVGFTRMQIAKRIGCSMKQVCRILGRADQRAAGVTAEAEPVVIAFYGQVDGGTAAAAKFGISRQTIFNLSRGDK